MLSIKEKLRSLERAAYSEENPKKGISTNVDFDSLGLAKQKNEYGKFIVREKRYPLDFKHGGYALENVLKTTHKNLEFINKKSVKGSFDINDFVFFDSETTGLAGGSGTYAFLCGFGFWCENEFVVKQFLLPSFEHELAYLFEISQLLKGFKGLVSFNGKSYDVPLLKTRFVLNRLHFNFDELLHIDLLHASRRLWKHKIQRCNLATLEEEILGFTRQNDVPGSKVPTLFFDYMKTGGVDLLLPVFKHNVIDILSMVSLVITMNTIYDDASNGTIENSVDKPGLARILIALDDYSAISRLFEQNKFLRDPQTGLEIANYMKKTKRLKNAVDLWERLLSGATFSEIAYLEMAKYYEHKELNYSKALEIVGRAIKRLEIRAELANVSMDVRYDDWYKRQARLLRKKQKSI